MAPWLQTDCAHRLTGRPMLHAAGMHEAVIREAGRRPQGSKARPALSAATHLVCCGAGITAGIVENLSVEPAPASAGKEACSLRLSMPLLLPTDPDHEVAGPADMCRLLNAHLCQGGF